MEDSLESYGSVQAVLDMLAAVSSTTMYVMQQCGPTSFIVKEESDGKQHHVTVGSLQQCTCHKRAQTSAELCRHIVFVMVKVLKVQPENPLVWQLSLIGESPTASCYCIVLSLDYTLLHGACCQAHCCCTAYCCSQTHCCKDAVLLQTGS